MRVFLVIFLSVFPLLSSQAGSLTKEDARAYREAGYRAQSMGDLESALVWYQKAVTLDLHFAQPYNDIGVIYETQGRIEEAVEMYKMVLEIDPEYLAAYTNLAFISEKKGNIEDAVYYWQRRYELGREGDYWWEVSYQHLLKLGTKYPKVRRKMLERKAARLSKQIIENNKQKRLSLIKEAKLHFDIGNQAFLEKDYKTATKEFKAVLFLNPYDEELLNKTVKLYKQSKKFFLRNKTIADAKNALDYIENNDYLSAKRELKDALETISRITQEE